MESENSIKTENIKDSEPNTIKKENIILNSSEVPRHNMSINKEWGDIVKETEVLKKDVNKKGETKVYKKPTQLKKRIKKKETPLLKVVQFAEKFSSTGAAFLLATLGIITQTFHNGFLFFELSSFENFWLNLLQTTIGAFGLSGALLYFTIRAANGGTKAVQNLVWAFFGFEIYANLYYWSNKYIISVWGTSEVNWSSMIIAVPFAIMIPFTIKAYAGELSFGSLLDDEEDEYIDENNGGITQEDLDNLGEDLKNNILDELSNSVNVNTQAIGVEVDGIKERISEIDKAVEKTIKTGESFKLNIDTKDEDGNKTTKVLTSVIEK